MSASRQFTATSALLLVCVHLSVGALLPVDKPAYRRTETETRNSLILSNRLFPSLASECASMTHLEDVNLPCPPDVSGCNSTVSSISANLNYLLYMYGYVLGLSHENNSIVGSELDKLELLEMVYSRLSTQLERYLQAFSRACNDSMCIVYQGFDKASIPEELTTLQQLGGYTHLELLKLIICHVRMVIFNIWYLPGFKENITVRPYRFCRSLPELMQYCPTQ